MTTEYAFQNDSGLTVLEGTIVPDPATALPSSAVYLTVGSAAPSAYTTPLVLDDTPSTGGLYAWDGTAYQQVAAALS